MDRQRSGKHGCTLEVVVVPSGPRRVWAECYRNPKVRPTVSFILGDEQSERNARRAAREHPVNRICPNCGLPCLLRKLDDDREARLLRTFGK